MGNYIYMGLLKATEIHAFDIAALDAVQRASPFGNGANRPSYRPMARVPPLGNSIATTTRLDENARPFMLNAAP